jgi:hypothetical protein
MAIVYTLDNNAGGAFSISGNTLQVSGPINFEATPTLQIVVRATDTVTGEYYFTITVTNVNEAPTIATLTPGQAATVGTAYTYTLPADAFADPDAGDTITYTATRQDGTALPTWLTFNPSTRTLSGTPASGDIATLALRIKATDAGGLSANDDFSLSVNAAVTTYLGQVATLSHVPNQYSGGSYATAMCRSRHKATQALSTATGLKIGLPGWYAPQTGGETAAASSISCTASIESAAGVILGQVKFGGAVTGSIAPNTTLISDAITLSATIPSGTYFFVRFWQSGASGFPYANLLNNNTLPDVANGEAVTFQGDTSDKTMVGGTITSTNAGVVCRPVCILGQTNAPSVAIVGDSRAAGLGDTHASETVGDLGEVARSLGAAGMAYINMGNPSDQLAWWNASHARRLELMGYCSHGVLALGINDLFGGSATDASLRTAVAAFRSSVPSGIKLFLTTLTTENTSSSGNREAHNDWRRTVPTGFTGCFDIADVTETARNSNVWKTPNYTADNIHATQYGYQQIAASGAVNTSLIVR